MKDTFANRLRTAMELRNMKQIDVVKKTGIGKSAISQYLSGKYEPKQKAIYKIAEILNVSESWVMGYDVPMERINSNYPHNILKIEVKKFPMLKATITPTETLFNDEIETYLEAGTNIQADFCMKMQDDSMINARIRKGDIVFIKQSDVVKDGDIAAVIIENEATLRRVYKKDNEIILISENSTPPMIFKIDENIRVLGKAVAFQSIIN